MSSRVVACAALLVALPTLAEPTRPPLVPGSEEQAAEGGTEMHFLAYQGEETYEVTVDGQSCTTPCTLRLRPGPTKVHLVGRGESDVQVVISHLTAQVRVSTGPPSWYTPAGAVFVPLGLVIAASMWAVGLACGFNNGGCMALNFTAWPVLGLTLFITGAVLLGLGNRAQPLDANRAEILDDVPGRSRTLRFQGLSLALLRDGASGLLAFSF